MNQQKKDFKVFEDIFKKAHEKKYKCLLCSEDAINSHLLQKNGILNLISSNGHVIQLDSKGFFLADDEGILDVKLLGINKAMSYPIFCNYHDTEIFSPIEKLELNLADYQSQLLFSYRALCSELTKKNINVETFETLKASNHFTHMPPLLHLFQIELAGNKIGIKSIEWYKDNFEIEINDSTSEQNFIFEKIEYDFMPISASAAYSPIDPAIHTGSYFSNPNNVLNYIFINLIPQADRITLLLGYHKNKSDKWIVDYINSWKHLTEIQFQNKLTDLFTTKIETWTVSPEYFSTFKPQNVALFKEYWNNNGSNLKIGQSINFNLFA